MYHLAQLNIAHMRGEYEDPVMAEFVANIDRVNAIADDAPGFVWRLQDEEGDATSIRPFGDTTLINMSVWESFEALKAFVFGPAHLEIMKRRGEWFERMEQAYVVLWWIPAGHIPGEEEAGERLALLRSDGPTPAAFNFREVFEPPR